MTSSATCRSPFRSLAVVGAVLSLGVSLLVSAPAPATGASPAPVAPRTAAATSGWTPGADGSRIPVGAQSGQPSPQCSTGGNGWFQPNCPYSWGFADVSVVRVDNDPNLGGNTTYYAFGTNTGGSMLPVEWATDPLAGPWTPRPAYTPNPTGDPYFNDALDAPGTTANPPPPWVRITGSHPWEKKELEAPGVARMPNGKWAAYFAGSDTNPFGAGQDGHWCIGRATADNVWGPYTADAAAMVCAAPDGSPHGLRDPQPFIDSDGTPYLIYKTEGVPGSGASKLLSRKLANDGTFAPGSTNTVLMQTDAAWQAWGTGSNALVENPAMIKFGGRYYLFYSGNLWTTINYGTGYAICSGPNGPCTDQSLGGPFLQDGPGYWGAGGADPFMDPNGGLYLAFAAWNSATPNPADTSVTVRKMHTTRLFALPNGQLTFADPAPAQRFIQAAYQDFLHRAPTADEISLWTAPVVGGSGGRYGLVKALAQSPEWLSAIVNQLYVNTLGRPGESGGVNYWVSQLASGAKSVADVSALFYASDEYYGSIGGGTDASWIADLYRKILLRTPDDAGVNYWVGQIALTSRGKVAARIFGSTESCHTRVKNLYATLLGRAPDASGWDYWAKQVGVNGDIVLAAQLASSVEYFNRAQTRFP